MAKVIRKLYTEIIEDTCQECPGCCEAYYPDCGAPSGWKCYKVLNEKERAKEIAEYGDIPYIPDWCPLPDAGAKESEASDD